MLPIYPDLRDRHVLITGGAGGIGAAVTDAFAAQGSLVTVLDKNSPAPQLVEQCKSRAGRVRFMQVDVTDESALIAALRTATAADGPVDVLINNAGYDPRYDTTEMTTKQWDDLIRLNLTHYFWTCREVLPAMKERRRGSIILVSSVNAWSGDEQLACYTATKSAALGFMKSLAREVGPYNIRVNAVAPGWIMTERQARDIATEEDKRRLVEEWQLLPFLLTPEHVAPTFLFFASDASAAITRQVLLVDAGIAMA